MLIRVGHVLRLNGIGIRGSQGRILMVTGKFKLHDEMDFATVLDNAGIFDERALLDLSAEDFRRPGFDLEPSR